MEGKMYTEKLEKRLQELETRQADLVKRSQESQDVDEIKQIEKELSDIKDDIAAIKADLEDIKTAKDQSTDEERNTETDKDNEEDAGNSDSKPEEDDQKNKDSENRSAVSAVQKQPQLRKVASYGAGAIKGENMDNTKNLAETRAAEFQKNKQMTFDTAETRSMLVSSGKIATPTKASGIEDNFSEVSSIVDLVTVEDCEGMGSDKVAFKKSNATATAKTEGDKNATSTGMTTDYVEIKPETLSAYDEISREVMKQTNLKYASKVQESAKIALRRAAAKKITACANTSKALDNGAKVEIEAINETTLRKIALSYGGDNEIPGNTYLFLTKQDLIAFGDVRGKNEKQAIYEIIPNTQNPNTGIIKDKGLSVNYCLNADLTQLENATAGGKTGENAVMLYGNPKTIKLDLFSNYDVRSSEDFKFDQGVIAIFGDVQCGCDVTHYNGMIKVLKKA